MAGALEGIRVLEFASFITGPLAAQMLGDMGAEVIKIEDPAHGDGMRGWEATKYASGFQAYNRNKKCLAVDLRAPLGREIVARLLPTADVVIENFRPGVAERLGVGYEQVRALNPRIVYCSISGLGQSGPYARRPTFDTTAQALSGLLSLINDQARPAGVTFCDNFGGMYAAYGILGALVARSRTGEGQRVDVTMVGAALAFITEAVSRYFASGESPSGVARCAVSQAFVFACGDGRALAVHLSTPDKFWDALLRAIDRLDLGQDPRFLNRAGRVENYVELYAALSDVFRQRPLSEWASRLDAEDVPNEAVLRVEEALASPKVAPLEACVQAEHPVYGAVRMVAPGARLSGTPMRTDTPPPGLGEHTLEVLAQCGWDAASIARFAEAGVVRTAVPE